MDRTSKAIQCRQDRLPVKEKSNEYCQESRNAFACHLPDRGGADWIIRHEPRPTQHPCADTCNRCGCRDLDRQVDKAG